jgi:signal transduction histidine kinase
VTQGYSAADTRTGDHFEQVCHDLKQSIATGLLLSDPSVSQDLDPTTRRRLEMLHQQWEEAAALVGLLNGDLGAEVHHTDLVEVTSVCVDAARAAREVTLEVDGREHVVWGNRVLLRRAVGNLLDNACRATEPAGHVVVRVGSRGAEIWVEVVDAGPGFGHIASGTGLGLEIVRAAVWASGGRLRIETGPRGGTSIRLTFPAALWSVS